MSAIIEAIGSPEFLVGLRWGGIAAGVGFLVAILWHRSRQEPAPLVGLTAAVAVLLAMPVVRPVGWELLAGVALLALAGAIFPWTRRNPLLPVVATLPGAWLVATSGLPGPGWVAALVFFVAAFTAPIVSWFDENSDGWPLPSLLFAIAAAGVFVTVPDTEEALVLLGAMAAPTLLAWPLRLARLGAIGAHALVGLFLWVIAWGGEGREGSVVGAAAALGMLVAAPLGSWIARKKNVATEGRLGTLLVVLQVLVVAVTTRVAGLENSAFDAVRIALPTFVVGVALWVVSERSVGPALSSNRTTK